ncbi:MAG: hypothetical protein CME13_12390 [Gemmatimonadetes bacterium]|jgi:hypothetical protein|nr:hypothetical protein [Gemmatimonadota bacterium]
MTMGTRKHLLGALVAAVTLVGIPEAHAHLRGPGVFLYRPGEGYDTHSREPYRHWPRSYLVRPEDLVFDELGDFVVEGIEVFSLRESRTLDPEPGSVINKSRYFRDYLSRLSVASDSYGDFHTTLAVGDQIRTKFTSLSLDMAALNGIRWDLSTKKFDFTLVNSRLDYPIWDVDANNDNKQHNASVIGTRPPFFATYLLGSHLQTSIGALNLGAQWVNQYRINSLLGRKKWDLRGATPGNSSEIDYLVVKFADGSIDDDGGPRVYDLQVYINGELRPELRVHPDAASASGLDDTQRIVVTRHHMETIDPAFPNGDEEFPREFGMEIPPYVEFISGQLPEEFPGQQGYLEAHGKEYLLYWVPLSTEDIDGVSFRAKVGNDYRISLSEVYANDPSRLRTGRTPRDRNRAMFFQDVAHSRGKVQDLSNLRVVKFDYGRQTGRMLAGVHADMTVESFTFRAEYDISADFRRYPVESGERSSRTGQAYFVNATWRGGQVDVGGEVFHMDPHYGTSLSIQDPAYQSFVTLPFSPLDSEIDGGLKGIDGFNQAALNGTLIFDTVEDNDDKDRFADQHYLRSRRDLDGIFPGLDLDQDGRPETNKNNNGIPDYLEPFLLYGVNPEEYDYGDDLNNNGVIDIRENDADADYPYDLDLKGLHLFGSFRPWEGATFTLGQYMTEQIAAGGQNNVTYVKAVYDRQIPFWGRFLLIDFAKKVEDDIRDNVFLFPRNATFELQEDVSGRFSGSGLGVTLIEDPLQMKDSFVNTVYAATDFMALAPIDLHLNVKHEFNHQFGQDGGESSRIERLTSVIKGQLPYHLKGRFRDVTITPQIKVMSQRLTDDRFPVPVLHEFVFYPIVRLNWELTPVTSFRAGAQGFPFLKSRSLDLVNPGRDFSTQDYVALIANTFTYQGYEVNFNAGYQIQRRQFDSAKRAASDVNTSIFFFRSLVGLRPVN